MERVERKEVFGNISSGPVCGVPWPDSAIPHRLSLHLLPVNIIPVSPRGVSALQTFCQFSRYLCREFPLAGEFVSRPLIGVWSRAGRRLLAVSPLVTRLTVHRGTVGTQTE